MITGDGVREKGDGIGMKCRACNGELKLVFG